MPSCQDFSEISVLIPGYSIEDLPTDLPEDSASSLLNAVACAWHPDLLRRSTSIPLFRQAESLSGYPGRRIVLVPTPSESWMPHEWRSVLRDQGHIVIEGCTSRNDWISAIDQAMLEDSAAAGSSDASSDSDEAATSRKAPSDLQDHFFSLGIVLLQTLLLSRRRHHFVDADNILLGRESRLAAEACFNGDDDIARAHLAKCFEHLRETRERFYPMNCYLVDICIPSEDEEPTQIANLLESKSPVNLFATGKDLSAWVGKEPSLVAKFRGAIEQGQLCLLTGHDSETRTSLGSMASTINDIERCRRVVTEITGQPPRHWARRRYGLTASLPAVLHYMGFESALHVALDDGLYPDRERSQFEWQAPDGSLVAAASRIPLAIDSASGFLRFADRYNESMQDDSTAALFLARLPTLKSPWLADLQIANSYAPVLGEFTTMENLCCVGSGSRLAERNEHADYLSPFLIQSSVLKTEPPISGPATLRVLDQRLESLRTALGIASLIKAVLDNDQCANQLQEIEKKIADLELQHVAMPSDDSNQTETLQTCADEIRGLLTAVETSLTELIRAKVPARPSQARGLFLTNSLPFSRLVPITWPDQWQRPVKHAAIELSERIGSKERLLVKLPPGGFAWLTECESAASSSVPAQATVAHPILEPLRNELPLAESLILRNRHFEVELSDRTGGVAAVMWHHQRGNRLSQQACFRYEREQTLPDDGSGEPRKSAYAVSQLVSHRILHNGTVFASLETVMQLHSPVDHSVLATVRQITSVDRVQPRIYIQLSFEDIKINVKGNPWLTYFGTRFAWENEAAAISRAVLGQVAGFRGERFESPDYVEICDMDHRVTIATHGRPYHRRSGPRMLDSMLLVEGESSRTFEFTMDFEQPFPLRSALDVMTPPIVQQTAGQVPSAISSSWVLGVSSKNVELVEVRCVPGTTEKSESMRLLISETDGSSADCFLKTARRPTAAFMVNADQTEKVALEVTDQGVAVSLNSFQIRGIELVF